MKSRSAPGVDGIGAIFYKIAADILAEPLTRLFQLSYDTGEVPEEWKESMITALYKNKGQRNCRSSYRPISLLLVSFKLMEKSMKFDLCDFFDDNDLWSPCQHAFRSRRSTLTCLLEATVQAEKWLDDPETRYVAFIGLDAMKAFDAVTFDALGRSLVDQGLPEKGIRWFLEGLSNRRFRVKVGGAFSGFQAPGSGIQQGSILSPICWNLHMQSLQCIMQEVPHADEVCKLHIYADDVCLSFRSRGPADENILQQVLDRYEKVAAEKAMQVHPEKSQILRIGKRSDTVFRISGKVIPEVEQLDALGVVLSANNKNDAHFAKVLRKVRQRVFMLRKMVRASDVVVRTIVWDLMMGSIIRYGYPAIKEFNLTQIRKLQSLQRLWMAKTRCCPLSCKHRIRRDPDEENGDQTCPKHVGPTPIYQTLAQEDLMVYYDLCSGKMNADINLPMPANKEVSTRMVAAGGFLQPPPISSAARDRSYSHRIVKLVNSLPQHLRVGLAEIRKWKELKPVRNQSSRLDVAQSNRVNNGRLSAFRKWANAPTAAPAKKGRVPTRDPVPQDTPGSARSSTLTSPPRTSYAPLSIVTVSVNDHILAALQQVEYFADFQSDWILSHMRTALSRHYHYGRIFTPPFPHQSEISRALSYACKRLFSKLLLWQDDAFSNLWNFWRHMPVSWETCGRRTSGSLRRPSNCQLERKTHAHRLDYDPVALGQALEESLSSPLCSLQNGRFDEFSLPHHLLAVTHELWYSHMQAVSKTLTLQDRVPPFIPSIFLALCQIAIYLIPTFMNELPSLNLPITKSDSLLKGSHDPEGPHSSYFDLSCPKLMRRTPIKRELGPFSRTIYDNISVNKTDRPNNEFKNIPSRGQAQAPATGSHSFITEKKKLLSRVLFKKGVRSDSLYSRPEKLDPKRYKPSLALQKVQEIRGKNPISGFLSAQPNTSSVINKPHACPL